MRGPTPRHLVQAVALTAFIAAAGCASRPPGSVNKRDNIFDCPVRECVGFDLTCKRETRDGMLTERNWRCLVGGY